MTYADWDGNIKVTSNSSDTSLQEFDAPGTYTVSVGDYSTEVELLLGGVYSLLITPTNDGVFVSN